MPIKISFLFYSPSQMNAASTAHKLMNAVANPQHLLRSLLSAFRMELSASMTRNLPAVESTMCQNRIHRIFDYTMGEGKFARSSLALRTYLALNPTPSDEQLQTAVRVSLTLEMVNEMRRLQTFFLIEDDVMDDGTLRRGKPCWHKLPDIGLNAINDGLLLDCGIDSVIRQSIPSHPKLHAILHDFSEAKQKTVIGQMLDTATTELDTFSWTRYASIVKNKTSHYSYFLPLIVGFHLADRTPTNQKELRHIAYRIGELFQAQDDYLDCFGDPKITGKSNLTDLAEGKCTWVTCSLVEKLSKEAPKRLALFRENFGSKNERQLQLARQIVLEEGIGQKFEHFQNRKVKEIRSELAQFPMESICKILTQTLDDIVNRQK